MTYKRMQDLMDDWYRGFKYKVRSHRFAPEIRVDTEPTFAVTNYTVTMRYNGKVIKRSITDQHLFHMKEENFFHMLNEMWEELNKTTTIKILDDPPRYANFTLRPYDPMVFGKKRLGDNIKRVIFSDPCTIVLWNDGTKTIVRCTDEKFDKEKGLAMCIAKKSLGNKGKYYDVFKKWIEEEQK